MIGVIDGPDCVAEGLRRRRRSRSFEGSVELICAHVDRMAEATRSSDGAALRSDLEGSIKPALTGIDHMRHVADPHRPLVRRYGADRARQVCSDNALRLLRENWSG